MLNAGKYNKRIKIYKTEIVENENGFQTEQKTIVLSPCASVKTTRGMTMIKNGTDFEKAYTNFTIRFPKTEINRDMTIEFHGKEYSIEYLNNVNEDGVELEIQAKEVSH